MNDTKTIKQQGILAANANKPAERPTAPPTPINLLKDILGRDMLRG